MSYEEQRRWLVEGLTAGGYLRSPEVIRAMGTVPRERFLPERVKAQAYLDTPRPIGFQQTISAPHMVAMMAEALELRVGHRVLEVGAGSGYHAAVLAEIVAPKDAERPGHIYTMEIVPELVSFAERNLKAAGYGGKVTVILGDGSQGHDEQAPYDRILVTAAAPKIPKALVEQLKLGGILLIPVGGLYFFQELVKVKKDSEGKLSRRSLGGVAFVPLRGEDGWKV